MLPHFRAGVQPARTDPPHPPAGLYVDPPEWPALPARHLREDAVERTREHLVERLAGGSPDALDELVGVVVSLGERLLDAEWRLARAEVALEHLGYDFDVPTPPVAPGA